MHVALIGGTGGVGSLVLTELLAREHDVLAIVRRADAIPAARGVTPKVADAHNTHPLARSLVGVDALISAFNPGWAEPRLYERYMSGARSIQAAAKLANVRLFVVGGASSLYDRDGRQLIETAAHPEEHLPGIRAARDYHQELLSETELDWTFLSPPPGFAPGGEGIRIGRYRTGTDTPLMDPVGQYSSISGQDLAAAVVDEIEAPHYRQQRFTVAY
jgi:putative NADH-flavin reductase